MDEDYSSNSSSLEERNKKFRFGIRSLSPDWLQVFRHPIAFTTILFLCGVVEGAIVSGLMSVIISSIERRYDLTSIMTGMLASIFDAVVVILILPVTYLSEKGHKPRWIGIGIIIHAIGALLFALPQFAGGPYLSAAFESDIDLCFSEVDFSQDCNSNSVLWVYFIFVVAVILMAIGAAPLFPVGVAFIDDIVWPKKVSVYLGVFQSSIIIGPGIGYALGGGLLLRYVDPFASTPLKSTDPSFVGMWWPGFILLGVVMLLLSIPLLMYPREIPESVLIRKEREKCMSVKSSEASTQSFKKRLRMFPRNLVQILFTPAFLLVALSGGLTYLILTGFASFGPKYVEVQFGVSSAIASYGVGAVGVVLGGAGIITGGLIVLCLKGSGRKAAFATFITTLISTLSTFVFFLNCPNATITGIPNNTSLGYQLLEGGLDTRSYNYSCTASCNCTSSLFQPVCHEETQLTYYSPCHAGCTNITKDGNLYTQCSCLYNSTMITDDVTNRKCGKCSYFIPFIILLGLVLFVAFTALTPITIVVVRSVTEEQRCTALGMQTVLFRILGGIPGPLTFGAIFDSTCILWQYECGSRGNCWEYNNNSLKYYLFSYTFVVCAARTVTVMFAWLLFGRNWRCKNVKEESNKSPATSDDTIHPQWNEDGETKI